jgi:hypothetical protein
MLWSAVLPIVVTFWALVVAMVGATVAAPRVGWRRGRTFAWGLVLAVVAFVPSCTVVMHAANAVRLGVGHYDNVDAIWDLRFRRWLPESASDIGKLQID